MESSNHGLRQRITKVKPPPNSPLSCIRSYQRQYFAKHKTVPRRKGVVSVPKCAAFGFSDLPILVKIAAVGMLAGILGAFVPHWAYISIEPGFYATFGLWHYCNHEYSHCELIHDNIMPGYSIPAWFVMMQYNFVIGVAMSLIVLAGLTHNMNISREIRMGPNMYMCMECVGAIAALQKFVSLYVFVSYFDQFTFLHDELAETDYHGAFYCAGLSFCCDFIVTIVLFLEEEIGPRPKSPNSSILLDAARDYEQDHYTYTNNGTDRYINLTKDQVGNLFPNAHETDFKPSKVHQS